MALPNNLSNTTKGGESAQRGIIWWNRLTRAERAHWLERAQSARPVDAWHAYQAGR